MKGFTLIELVVAFGILLLVAGGVLTSYNNFNDTQKVKQAGATLRTNLRSAQARAIAGLKPQSGCSQLDGYDVGISTSQYYYQARCTPEGLAGEIVTVILPTGVTISSPPALPIRFNVLSGGVTNATTITITGYSQSFNVVVGVNGEIE